MKAGSMERVFFAASAAAHLLVLAALIALRPAGFARSQHADVIRVSLHAPAHSQKNSAARSVRPAAPVSIKSPRIEQAVHEQHMPAESAQPDVMTVTAADAQTDASVPVEAASSGSTASGAPQDGVHEMIRERIRAMIQERVRYPAIARKRGVEGTVVAGFSVGPEGRPGRVRLLRSSGHALLDREVLRAVERASPYPTLSRAVEVPVTFRITAD